MLPLCLGPNFIKTEAYFPQELLAKPGVADKIAAGVPLGRMGEPDEVADLIAFLLSSKVWSIGWRTATAAVVTSGSPFSALTTLTNLPPSLTPPLRRRIS